MRRFQTVRGMRDFLPSEASKLRFVEACARKVAGLYGFEEIITPVVESYELLAAKSGGEIKARMYTFNDLGGRKVSLRPEFTASIARLVSTTLRNEPKPLRLFSAGTTYRYDEPQFGRYREFWQSNFELIGSRQPEADVEIISLTNQLFQELGLRNYWFKIGHVGVLRGLLTEENVDEDVQNNMMQLLDAKRSSDALTTARTAGVSKEGLLLLTHILKEKGRNTQNILRQAHKRFKDYPSSLQAIENLAEIITLIESSKTELDILLELGFARGLEYYTGMIFEPCIPEMTISVGGGGRYDKLVETFGGEPTPAVGVAHGLDRITLAIDKQEINWEATKMTLAVVTVNERTLPTAIKISEQLRNAGYSVELEVTRRTISKALQHANRKGASYAVIIGPRELKEDKVLLRNMKNRQQYLTDIEDLGEAVSKEASGS